MLAGVSDGESTATSLPNDGEAEDATTPTAPSSSHKGILYCQVPARCNRELTYASLANLGFWS